jgi:hypothetical protein
MKKSIILLILICLLVSMYGGTAQATNKSPFLGPFMLEPVIYEEIGGVCIYHFDLDFNVPCPAEAIYLHVYFNVEGSRGGYAHFWTASGPTSAILVPMDATQIIRLPPDTICVEVSCCSSCACGIFSANVYWIDPVMPSPLPNVM